MSEFIQNALGDAASLLETLQKDSSILSSLNEAVVLFGDTLEKDGKILSCGNGGSMCDSMHFAEELTGRFRKDRRALNAHAISDPSHISCVANDFGYDQIFAKAVEGWGREGDALLAISTSGNSKNVICAAEMARAQKMKTVGLLGKDGGKLKDMVDIPIVVPHSVTDRIQEIHIKMIHIMIEGIERKLFPEHYQS